MSRASAAWNSNISLLDLPAMRAFSIRHDASALAVLAAFIAATAPAEAQSGVKLTGKEIAR